MGIQGIGSRRSICFFLAPGYEVSRGVLGVVVGPVVVADAVKGVAHVDASLYLVDPLRVVEEYGYELTGHIYGVGIGQAVGEGAFQVLDRAVLEGVLVQVYGAVADEGGHVVEARELDVLHVTVLKVELAGHVVTDEACETEGDGVTAVVAILVAVIYPAISGEVLDGAVLKGDVAICGLNTDEAADSALVSDDGGGVNGEVLESHIHGSHAHKARAHLGGGSALLGIVIDELQVGDGVAVTLEGHAEEAVAVQGDPLVAGHVDVGQENDGQLIRNYAIENNVSVFTALDTVKVLLDVLEETTLCISTIDA